MAGAAAHCGPGAAPVAGDTINTDGRPAPGAGGRPDNGGGEAQQAVAPELIRSPYGPPGSAQLQHRARQPDRVPAQPIRVREQQAKPSTSSQRTAVTHHRRRRHQPAADVSQPGSDRWQLGEPRQRVCRHRAVVGAQPARRGATFRKSQLGGHRSPAVGEPEPQARTPLPLGTAGLSARRHARRRPAAPSVRAPDRRGDVPTGRVPPRAEATNRAVQFWPGIGIRPPASGNSSAEAHTSCQRASASAAPANPRCRSTISGTWPGSRQERSYGERSSSRAPDITGEAPSSARIRSAAPKVAGATSRSTSP